MARQVSLPNDTTNHDTTKTGDSRTTHVAATVQPQPMPPSRHSLWHRALLGRSNHTQSTVACAFKKKLHTKHSRPAEPQTSPETSRGQARKTACSPQHGQLSQWQCSGCRPSHRVSAGAAVNMHMQKPCSGRAAVVGTTHLIPHDAFEYSQQQ